MQSRLGVETSNKKCVETATRTNTWPTKLAHSWSQTRSGQKNQPQFDHATKNPTCPLARPHSPSSPIPLLFHLRQPQTKTKKEKKKEKNY
ncbi:hypothetical protein BpHYR1_040242 [Brachionus plicatilis]|uniref:Uncharacterized protein n=1 Tax=Brachionus plicatilis TaxID=10195 RepID=A0A3M7R3Z4_BRAPC|nr:hypothetical protein BpHYR1_040242 [Brachionus plicatilis]